MYRRLLQLNKRRDFLGTQKLPHDSAQQIRPIAEMSFTRVATDHPLLDWAGCWRDPHPTSILAHFSESTYAVHKSFRPAIPAIATFTDSSKLVRVAPTLSTECIERAMRMIY